MASLSLYRFYIPLCNNVFTVLYLFCLVPFTVFVNSYGKNYTGGNTTTFNPFHGEGWVLYHNKRYENPETYVMNYSIMDDFYFFFLKQFRFPQTKKVVIPPSNDTKEFRKLLRSAKKIVIISASQVSALSGIDTHDATMGNWEEDHVPPLSDDEMFDYFASEVWEYFNFRREYAFTKKPNIVHAAVAAFEAQLRKEGLGRTVTVITPNTDSFHITAGSHNVIEVHGSLFNTQCTQCEQVVVNRDNPICEALRGRGCREGKRRDDPEIPEDDLPHCKKKDCGALLRPYLKPFNLGFTERFFKAERRLRAADLVILLGTSATLYDAERICTLMSKMDKPVVQFNNETSKMTKKFKFFFKGNLNETVPQLLRL